MQPNAIQNVMLVNVQSVPKIFFITQLIKTMIAIVNNVINSDHAIGLISFILSPLATRDESLRQQKGDVNE